jgi:hypothetical protein
LEKGQEAVSKRLERVVLIGRDLELRIVSLAVRAREVANDVVLFDTGSNDETMELAHEIDCQVVSYGGSLHPREVCQALESNNLDEGTTLFLPITAQWKLSELPLSVNRSREGWDIHYVYLQEDDHDGKEGDPVMDQTNLRHLIVSPAGCRALASLPDNSPSSMLDDGLKVRLVEAEQPIQLPQRQSLATASRFAQLFYWMLESKHPLLLFGIPGVVLFVLGYRLSGDLASMFTELNSTSIGVTLVTIAMTLIGLFAMMVALILYIMGKQVARVQHQYNWPNNNTRG